MELKQKVELKSKGDSIILKQKGDYDGPFHATLRWRSSVDLDLHCYYRLKSEPPQATGFFGKIGQALGGGGKRDGHICFSSKGSKNGAPWITLDKDSGVGDVGGDNEENMHFWDIDKVESAIIVANIFSKKTNFAQYQSTVIISGSGREFEVPLTETQTGSWCIVGRIDNSGSEPKLINVNKTQNAEPNLIEFI